MIVPKPSDYINDTVTISMDEYMELIERNQLLQYLEHIAETNGSVTLELSKGDDNNG